jgi:hypothetical protein
MDTHTVYACPDHAPAGVAPVPNDDGRPMCDVCGTSNYAVKPYRVPARDDLYWRLANGRVVRPRGHC